MQRNKVSYSINPERVGEIKKRMLNWSQQFSILLFLDNNQYESPLTSYECLLAAGGQIKVTDGCADPLSRLKEVHNDAGDWLFGHIGYDFKNVVEPKLSSRHKPKTEFPLFSFFVPETVCYINRQLTELTIETFGNSASVYAEIIESTIEDISTPLPKLTFTKVIGQEQYLETIRQLRNHIKEGDCYEINFCSEGYCESAQIAPLAAFNALNQLSPAPFAAYYRLNGLYMMCASPERYMCKKGSKIISQPIKGTARRDADKLVDEQIKVALKNDIKERAENVMIVDLVRNDLARCCETGSVQVDELFGIYTFPQVHQMISTISGTLKNDCHFTDALRYSFPMGSMTGAPKYKVMQLVEQYEQSRRELYSGTVGYITPEGDFDFNVVIRTLFYNAESQYLNYQTGGAITWDSVPEQEWDEMRLKAWALERIFA